VLSYSWFHSLISVGFDGADQMAAIVFIGAGVGCLRHTMVCSEACVLFIGMQACLSYAISGIAKLVSRGWRNGYFLPRILGTASYGHPRLSALLLGHPRVSQALSLGVIGWEVVFAITIILPTPILYGALAAGFVFHIAVAVTMGLNNFVWSFCATYPCLVLINRILW
jgi:hypothetical protein